MWVQKRVSIRRGPLSFNRLRTPRKQVLQEGSQIGYRININWELGYLFFDNRIETHIKCGFAEVEYYCLLFY
jgi:hypothetical protein